METVFNLIIQKIKFRPKLAIFLSGVITTFAFAPYFIVICLASLSIIAYHIKHSDSAKKSFFYGWLFGLGFFISSLYWISIALTIDIEQFWWVTPFSIIGLPSILAIFTAFVGVSSWYIYKYLKKNFFFIFSICWVFIELIRSWIFTGFPWQLLGYSLSFSTVLIQSASIFGVYGLSFFVIYIFSGLSCIFNSQRREYLIMSGSIIFLITIFGIIRLSLNSTQFSDILIRIVQPSIVQKFKWTDKYFEENLERHIKLSRNDDIEPFPDIIIWPEDAVVVPYTVPYVLDAISFALIKDSSILITGGVNDTKYNQNYKIYSAMYAINTSHEILFEYHKQHLVPFGEYMPLRKIIPIKKITNGEIDYSSGKTPNTFVLDMFKGLKITPLICYEAIFPEEVRKKSNNADVIINITNDSWYGNSSGPYQHFYMTVLRAVENGIPLIRSANNGISAFIDPLGRIISSTKLYQIISIDSKLPIKLKNIVTLYSKFGNILLLIFISMVYIGLKISNFQY